ncbi:hypothetical protein Skr01_22030 [Sphaerisporangium krabiense]|uniref:Uncharacterized protein n=1 Tax=Sphaerisporangium krabiense TaxID=763782 RepID=A0A7W8Z5U1_9ACTN|nr:hypothetical protein [Sphaerisporangium krabiense]GII62118.1 hypothetical protein Skr01_22030 [Sphaerisporangium krabiense]
MPTAPRQDGTGGTVDKVLVGGAAGTTLGQPTALRDRHRHIGKSLAGGAFIGVQGQRGEPV